MLPTRALMLAALTAVLVGCAAATDIRRADIGVLVDLHDDGHSQGARRTRCSVLNVAAVQPVLAARWAADVVSSQAHQVAVDVRVFDTCADPDTALRDTFFAVKEAIEQQDVPLLGLVGLGDAEVVGRTVSTLNAFHIPLVLASPRLAEMVAPETNTLTTAPDMASIVQAVVELGKALGVESISVVSSCPHSLARFKHDLEARDMRLGRVLQVKKHSAILGDVVRKFLEEAEDGETIALVLEPEEISGLAQSLRSYRLASRRLKLITGTIGLNHNLMRLWRNLFAGSFLIEPHMPELPDFRNYLLSTFGEAQTNVNETLVREYMSIVYSCHWFDDLETAQKHCKNLSIMELSHKLQINPEVTFVVKAVSAFSAALFLLRASRCEKSGMTTSCLDSPDSTLARSDSADSTSLQQEMLTMLSQLTVPSGHDAPFELSGTRRHLTHDGRLVANKYSVARISEEGDVVGIGWYSDDKGLLIDSSMQRVASAQRKASTSDRKQPRGFSSDSTYPMFQNEPQLDSLTVVGEGVDARKVAPDNYLARLWATIMVAFAAVGTLVTLFILVYVLIKICDGTLAGNQSLGVILLLGIMTLFACVVPFVLPVSETKCGVRVMIYPVALALCYGILLVKVMQLRSLVLLGLGGRISYLNQYIILFFIVLVQVVINVQWYMTNGPHLRVDSEGTAYCVVPRTDFLMLHTYIVILVVLAFGYGLSVLKIRRNYKEGRWVTLAAFLSLPILVGWGLVFGLAAERYDELTTCVALMLLATILILAVFIPKMSTISKQAKDFKHKKMHVGADSVNTIFTNFSDLQRTSSRLRPHHSRRPGSGHVPIHISRSSPMAAVPSHTPHLLQHNKHLSVPHMADAYSDYVTKNPIYEVTNGAYP
ncbi:Metabotropic glutamate receptor 3 [Frankliniella fusca]|uniref:Metabotropic glutamate receptor 3 n=1 Tax=Frankliniella fusca TaxID=407009 RepID=A0AAE1LW06_9NEOP|nr:Metabotropic glutamate receptor 3 [Frankliniella fusca]